MYRRPLHNALRDLRQFITLDQEKRQQYLYHPDRSFTRQSPLLFSRTVLMVLGLLRNSLSIELNDFFGRLHLDTVTKSAFCQRRQLIKPDFFRDFFVLTADTFYHRFKIKRWKNFRLMAVDGTGFRLPEDNDIGETFGWHGNQHNRVPSVRGLYTFDVLNKIIYNVDHHPRKDSEVRIAYSRITQFEPDFLAIYDRGFAGAVVPLLHVRHGSHCVVRLKTSGNPLIEKFIESTDYETTTIVSP